MKTSKCTSVSKSLFLMLFLFINSVSYGQGKPKVIIPPFNDKYSEYVKKLEAGKTDIDYQDFRFSFIESKQFKIAFNKMADLIDIHIKIVEKTDSNKYKDVINLCNGILTDDYTDAYAHMTIQKSFQKLGDSLSAKKHEAIYNGLINSILSKGDGKTCKTGWPVIQVGEEYYIMNILNARLVTQSMISEDKQNCDAMEVEINGEKVTLYFNINKVTEGYNKLMMK